MNENVGVVVGVAVWALGVEGAVEHGEVNRLHGQRDSPPVTWAVL